jgi:hypothetical protein
MTELAKIDGLASKPEDNGRSLIIVPVIGAGGVTDPVDWNAKIVVAQVEEAAVHEVLNGPGTVVSR